MQNANFERSVPKRKSGFMRALRVLTAALLILIVIYVLYPLRYSVEATVWHWRHGYSASVGPYEVPVPKHWLLTTHDDHNLIDLTDTSIERETRIGFASSLAVSVLTRPLRELDSWASLTVQQLRGKGLTDIDEKTFNIGTERVICIGGPQFREVMHTSIPPVAMECRSAGRLSVIFVGDRSELEEFYSIVSSIRERK